MAHPSDPTKEVRPSQPDLANLLSGYLQRQADAHTRGLAVVEPTDEVVPHEAGPVQPIDPRLAWDEAVAAAQLFGFEKATRSWPAPPSWSSLVAGHAPVAALPLCLGNFPQLVRDLQGLLRPGDLKALAPAAANAPAPADEVTPAGPPKDFAQTLVFAALRRLARQFDGAAAVLATPEEQVPAAWRPAWKNEQAALLWHRGQVAEARSLWQAQPDSVPVHFNRGMAALFLGDAAEARAALAQAVAGLSEDGGWYHLARLYLALAEARG
jgi:hypothetical protein